MWQFEFCLLIEFYQLPRWEIGVAISESFSFCSFFKTKSILLVIMELWKLKILVPLCYIDMGNRLISIYIEQWSLSSSFSFILLFFNRIMLQQTISINKTQIILIKVQNWGNGSINIGIKDYLFPNENTTWTRHRAISLLTILEDLSTFSCCMNN